MMFTCKTPEAIPGFLLFSPKKTSSFRALRGTKTIATFIFITYRSEEQKQSQQLSLYLIAASIFTTYRSKLPKAQKRDMP